MTKTRKGLPFIKFELPRPKKPSDKQPSRPRRPKPRPEDRLTTMAVGEEGGHSR